MAHAHLKILKPRRLQGFHQHGDHFPVRLDRGLLDQLRAQLGRLLQPAAQV